MAREEQSEGSKLLAEFKGQKIAGKNLAALSMKIDGLIRIKVNQERHRCFDVVRDVLGKIIEVESNGSR